MSSKVKGSYVSQKPYELKGKKVAMSARSHTSSKVKGSYVSQKPYELKGQR